MCQNVNECADPALFQCPNQSVCQDTPGGYECICESGYALLVGVCSNINECADPDLDACDTNAACFEETGSFSCSCNAGYIGSGSTCSDVQECESSSASLSLTKLGSNIINIVLG